MRTATGTQHGRTRSLSAVSNYFNVYLRSTVLHYPS